MILLPAGELQHCNSVSVKPSILHRPTIFSKEYELSESLNTSIAFTLWNINTWDIWNKKKHYIIILPPCTQRVKIFNNLKITLKYLIENIPVCILYYHLWYRLLMAYQEFKGQKFYPYVIRLIVCLVSWVTCVKEDWVTVHRHRKLPGIKISEFVHILYKSFNIKM